MTILRFSLFLYPIEIREGDTEGFRKHASGRHHF
uniref:Uncharacterized protein n=1 Tax=Siphoviridae sp. ctWsj12 TaxID=2826363 RepID=A0A8S5NR82_9CAUD|nr:MAG TPA: hypothetical protein [Siphoviridae sp. ctWsj12]